MISVLQHEKHANHLFDCDSNLIALILLQIRERETRKSSLINKLANYVDIALLESTFHILHDFNAIVSHPCQSSRIPVPICPRPNAIINTLSFRAKGLSFEFSSPHPPLEIGPLIGR